MLLILYLKKQLKKEFDAEKAAVDAAVVFA